ASRAAAAAPRGRSARLRARPGTPPRPAQRPRPSRRRPRARAPRSAPRSRDSGPYRLPVLSICARFRHEALEELRVVSRLGMPEDADRKSLRGIFDALDRAVLGPRRLAQPLPHASEALMMVRLDRRHLGAEQRA